MKKFLTHMAHDQSNNNTTLLYISSAVLGVSLMAGSLQSYITKYVKGQSLETYSLLLNVFNAGTQLSTLLIDLIPHISISEQTHHSHDANHLYPYILIGISFIFLLGLDHLYIQKEISNKNQKNIADSIILQKIQSSEHTNKTKNCCAKHITEEDQKMNSENIQNSRHQHNIHEHSHNETSTHSGNCCGGSIAKAESFGNALIRISAISIHSFFEGFGVQENNGKISLVLGIFLHKFLESFNVAVALSNLKFPIYNKILLFIFYAILTPIAICFKLAFPKILLDKIQLWCNSLCVGALLFVVFYEIISDSFRNRKYPKLKVSIILLGYLLGCLAIIFAHTGHHHDHSSDCKHNHHDHHHDHSHDHNHGENKNH